ncbi:MAG: N-acetylmuramoyl-L-alanine amidase, partial [Hyphomicrobiales bacterium]
GRTWSDWQRIHIETRPGTTASNDHFGALSYAPGATAVRYRVRLPAGNEGPVERVSITLIDTGPASRRALAQTTVTATPSPSASPAASATPSPSPMATPAETHIVLPGLASDWPAANGAGAPYDQESGATLGVVSRAAWAADDSLRFAPDGHEIWKEMFVPIRLLVVHHTASRNDYAPGESVDDVRAIYYYHAVGHGWGDIGYNALIDRYGVIYEGRHGRGGDPGEGPAEVLSEALSAGHAKYHNYGSAGVALIGNADEAGWEMYEPSGPRWEALVAYCTFEARRGFLRPLNPDGSPATAAFLRSDNAWQFDAPKLGGHIDYEETLCPGAPVIALLPALRAAVHERLSGTSRTGCFIASALPEGLEVPAGTTLSVTWTPELPEPGWEIVGFEYRFEGWFKPETSDDITYLAGYSNATQPEPRWTWAPAYQREASFRAKAPGQYTFSVRAVIRSGGTVARAAYAPYRSWLVR